MDPHPASSPVRSAAEIRVDMKMDHLMSSTPAPYPSQGQGPGQHQHQQQHQLQQQNQNQNQHQHQHHNPSPHSQQNPHQSFHHNYQSHPGSSSSSSSPATSLPGIGSLHGQFSQPYASSSVPRQSPARDYPPSPLPIDHHFQRLHSPNQQPHYDHRSQYQLPSPTTQHSFQPGPPLPPPPLVQQQHLTQRNQSQLPSPNIMSTPVYQNQHHSPTQSVSPQQAKVQPPYYQQNNAYPSQSPTQQQSPYSAQAQTPSYLPPAQTRPQHSVPQPAPIVSPATRAVPTPPPKLQPQAAPAAPVKPPSPTPMPSNQIPPGGAPARRYLNDNVTPALLEGMKMLAREQPKDPLLALAKFLEERHKELENDKVKVEGSDVQMTG